MEVDPGDEAEAAVLREGVGSGPTIHNPWDFFLAIYPKQFVGLEIEHTRVDFVFLQPVGSSDSH